MKTKQFRWCNCIVGNKHQKKKKNEKLFHTRNLISLFEKFNEIAENYKCIAILLGRTFHIENYKIMNFEKVVHMTQRIKYCMQYTVWNTSMNCMKDDAFMSMQTNMHCMKDDASNDVQIATGTIKFGGRYKHGEKWNFKQKIRLRSEEDMNKMPYDDFAIHSVQQMY